MDDDLVEVILEPRRPEPRQDNNDAAFIDLTADPDSPPARAPQRSHNNHNNNNHNHTANLRPGRTPPARLGSAAAAGNHDPNPVIDLTADEPSPEPRRLQPPQPQLPRVSLEPDDLDDIIILRSLRHQRTHSNRRPPPHERPRLSSTFLPTITSYLGMHLFPSLDQYAAPPNLNYQRPAFDPPPPPPPPAAAPHRGVGSKMEVPKAKEGFTRDTGEETVVVCPACGGELEYDPVKSEGKKRKRDKGEHHFWAVKKCGHVYCRECFDSRRPTAKTKSKFRGPDGASDPQPQTKKVLCAVEDCGEDVTNKGAWVGIYL